MGNADKPSINSTPKVTIVGYISLFFALLFFSGLLSGLKSMNWVTAFDFTTLVGNFGTMKDAAKSTFVGVGGIGARQGFLFGIYLIPAVMLAIGMIELLNSLGALSAAQKLMTPLLKPLLGIPGASALILVANVGGSSDAGAILTKQLRDEEIVTEKQRIIMTAWQFSAAGTIINYFASGAALFSWITVPIIIPLAVIIGMKFVGANLVRIYLSFCYKEGE